MNSSWQEHLKGLGAHIENDFVGDFGDPAAERLAARDGTVIAPLVHLGLLECSGEDAKEFLHNQLTSDVKHLGAGAAQHSAWCTAKGRMLASFVLFLNGPDYRALLSADLREAIAKRLRIYVLRAKVKITDLTANYEFIGLSGPRAEAALQGIDLPVPTAALGATPFSNGTVIRLGGSRFAIVAASEAAPGIWSGLAEKARAVGTPVWHWLDVQAGVPLISGPTSEAFVPQMANFDKIGGVSFHKGCYPGQEVVARTQYLGKVKRHLYRIHTTTPVAPGAAIYLAQNAEQACGMVANAAPAPGEGTDALAVVQEGFSSAADLRLEGADARLVSIEPVVV